MLAVREILEYEQVTRVPRTPAYIRGVINLRGRVVPVMDLAVRFGLPRASVTSRSCVVIVEVTAGGEPAVMGLMVDAVHQVMELSPSDIETPPSFGTRADIQYLRGLGRAGKRFLLLLDIERLFADGEDQAAAMAAEVQPGEGLVAPHAPSAPAPGRARRRGCAVADRFLLDRILERGSLSVHFQAVLDVHAAPPHAHYLEALVRGPRGTTAEAPSILFEYARNKSKEALVDRACVSAIIEASVALPSELMVGINVHASSLAMDGGFVDFLASALAFHGISPRRVVIEIVEHAPPWDVVGFRTALTGLRRLGARIALDDVGLGHSNYMMIYECRPDYLKVDRYFVDGCHADFHRRAVLASVAQLAGPFGARVVAEGVESVEDMIALRRLGITLVQGYLFGQPAPAAETVASVAAHGGRNPGCPISIPAV